nr:WhiB family transcriptional regulator [Aestuariimicrobium ganziense]
MWLAEQADLPCQDHDPEVFFADAPATVEFAKTVCGPCPLREECLAGALRRREPHGVWGGELFQNGVVIARKRPRGRPPKHPRPLETVPAAAQVVRAA